MDCKLQPQFDNDKRKYFIPFKLGFLHFNDVVLSIKKNVANLLAAQRTHIQSHAHIHTYTYILTFIQANLKTTRHSTIIFVWC